MVLVGGRGGGANVRRRPRKIKIRLNPPPRKKSKEGQYLCFKKMKNDLANQGERRQIQEYRRRVGQHTLNTFYFMWKILGHILTPVKRGKHKRGERKLHWLIIVHCHSLVLPHLQLRSKAFAPASLFKTVRKLVMGHCLRREESPRLLQCDNNGIIVSIFAKQ